MIEFKNTFMTLDLLHRAMTNHDMPLNAQGVNNVRTDLSTIVKRLEAAEAELARRDAAASEVVHLYREHNPCNGMKTDWIEIDSEQFASLKESTDPETAEFSNLQEVATPAVLPPKYAGELKDRDELIEAYSKTQCEIAQELGCDSDNESILKAIYDLKEQGAQSAVLPPEMTIKNAEDSGYQIHGYQAGYNQCRADTAVLCAQPQKPVVLPLPEVAKFGRDHLKAYAQGEVLAALDAANVLYEVKK